MRKILRAYAPPAQNAMRAEKGEGQAKFNFLPPTLKDLREGEGIRREVKAGCVTHCLLDPS